MAGRLQDKVAFITGAARGQGRTEAVRFAEEGADVIAVDLCAQVDSVVYPMSTPEDLAETARLVEATGRRIVTTRADVRDKEALRAALDAGVAALGRLDIVIANAGIWSGAPAAEMSSQTWQDMIDINLTGVWNTCQVAIPHLVAAGSGSMTLTSSTAGLGGAANIAHYAAAKHGVVGMMRSLAKELAPRNIRVNTIHPTSVATDMLHNDAMFKLFRPDLENPTLKDAEAAFGTLNMLPVPWVEAIDIANAALFLASDEARYITSVALPVDAGSSQI